MGNLFSFQMNAVSIIQLMLAPAVMISACGLLLLGMNNRYSLVVNRIRLLNEEKRRLLARYGEKPLSSDDNIRLESILIQIKALTFRVKLVRNSVISYVTAVGLYVSTSLLIGVSSVMAFHRVNYLIIITFLLGMISLLVGVIFAGFETKKGFDIIKYEVQSHE
ncbi:MAG: DUF2721 domain-containing protein [Ignavibacteriales bacterium CG_4_9_14_3_um_filter_34_10]|nr:MAG: DUF2721 domain-containing protein [Ignavibacteriales bacterium CG_4_9_14_3_um_filter_34_10]